MKRLHALCAAAVFAALSTAAPASAGNPGDAIAIESLVTFGDGTNVGEFVVGEGAGALGCSAGTLVDTVVNAVVWRTLTCTAGGSGTFTIRLMPWSNNPGPGDLNGRWNVSDASGDFVGLYGVGAFAYYRDREGVTDTLVGVIGYTR